MERTELLGLRCVRVANALLELLVTEEAGPRILSPRVRGGENLLSEVPDAILDSGGSGQLYLWGGHRLWHAPEIRERTYIPDDEPVSIEPLEEGVGVRVVQPVEEQTGIQKAMNITLDRERARVTVEHVLTNKGLWAIETAAWAITSMRPGGFAILPQWSGKVDPDGFQPNRSLVFWPYSDVRSPHLTLGNRYVFIHSNMTEGALKVGFPNPVGWLAYHQGNTLFVKSVPWDPDAYYYDRGSSSQCYCGAAFTEIETLGPRERLEPGASLSHTETWDIYEGITLRPEEDEVARVVEELGLALS